MLRVIYRISNGSYKKNRLESATKEHCLDNFLSVFRGTSVLVLMDGCDEKTTHMVKGMSNYYGNCTQTEIHAGSSAQSFNAALDVAVTLDESDHVYFVEDDYLHLPKSPDVLMEGLERAHYVSLYDHPDKYINGDDGGNPHVDDGGEITRVFRTQSCHWKLTNSTTMTFATSVRLLKIDAPLWREYTKGTYPRDFEAFIQLRNLGRTLATPIPGYSTHTEVDWLSPYIDWSKV